MIRQLIILILLCLGLRGESQVIIDPKGTKHNIDSSKWIMSGNHIYNKNSGNLGIGVTNPTAQLHTSGTVRFAGIGSNTSNTRIMSTDEQGNVSIRSLSSLLTDNAITSLNGLTSSTQTFSSGTTGTDFNIVSSGTSHSFNFPTASSVNRGLLNAVDWTTFNNKENALTFSSGLSRNANTISINTTQNIQALSNLTSNGLIKTTGGNGTLSIATAGTDYSAGTASLSTGILKSSTGTGTLSIASAGDFPTLNQNTTGSAASLTTSRLIYGNSFNGSTDVTGIIASNFGGTGNGFTKFSGASTSEKTYTLPDANATILTDNSTVTVAQGGTGATSLTGIIKGNGTSAFTAATAGTDYSTGTASLATGILRSTTGTGTLSIASAGDFPILNQNTTGSAATLTTSRLIYGNSFNGSSDVTGVIGANFGGTGNGFTQFSGPTTSTKTFTLPNASATILTTNAAVTPAQGGTGISSYAIGDLLFASGSTTLSKLAGVATGNALISGGVGTAPSWGKIGLGNHVSGLLPVANGGTNSSATLNNNRIMISASGSIVESAALTNGQLLIGSTSSAPVATTLTAGSGINIVNGNGSITISSEGSGGGSVDSVYVISSNGFSGSVDNPTTTPAITLGTSVNGMVKGNGTAISAATTGTDYSAGTSSLATGILKSTTGTGTLSIAAAGDFPTLNQNTTGSAATLTTSRLIYGNSFNGSANVTGIIAASFGGTGNGFTQFAGPTSSTKTFTLPNASATILTSNAAVTVPQGGTGVTSHTANSVLLGNGTASITNSGVSTGAGQVLQTSAAGGTPDWAIGQTYVILANDVVNNNSTANTMQDVTGLSFPVTAGVTYRFKAMIIYTAQAASTGSRWSITGPANPTIYACQGTYALSATTATTVNTTAYDMPANCNANSAHTIGNIAMLDGIITPSANGTVIVRFASEIANSAITAKAGSSLAWW